MQKKRSKQVKIFLGIMVMSLSFLIQGCHTSYNGPILPPEQEMFFVVDTIQINQPVIVDRDAVRYVLSEDDIHVPIRYETFPKFPSYVFCNDISDALSFSFIAKNHDSFLSFFTLKEFRYSINWTVKTNSGNFRCGKFIRNPNKYLLLLVNVAAYNDAQGMLEVAYSGIKVSDGKLHFSNPTNVYIRVVIPIE